MSVKYKIKPINNKRFPDEEPSYAVSLVTGENLKRDDIARRMNTLSSFSKGDLSGLIDNLVTLLAENLAQGNTVTLDGLGTFYISAEFKKKVTDPETVTGNDIRLKRVCFKPTPSFKEEVAKQLSFQKLDPDMDRLR